jgi:hypothetical protein
MVQFGEVPLHQRFDFLPGVFWKWTRYGIFVPYRASLCRWKNRQDLPNRKYIRNTRQALLFTVCISAIFCAAGYRTNHRPARVGCCIRTLSSTAR